MPKSKKSIFYFKKVLTFKWKINIINLNIKKINWKRYFMKRNEVLNQLSKNEISVDNAYKLLYKNKFKGKKHIF